MRVAHVPAADRDVEALREAADSGLRDLEDASVYDVVDRTEPVGQREEDMALADWYRGKRVVITGASSGIGRDLALLLGGFGAHLALNARRREPMDAIAADLRNSGVEVLVYPADV